MPHGDHPTTVDTSHCPPPLWDPLLPPTLWGPPHPMGAPQYSLSPLTCSKPQDIIRPLEQQLPGGEGGGVTVGFWGGSQWVLGGSQ